MGENMKAISPVISTVIIVAIAIAISIGVALWVTGVVGSLTGGRENLMIMPDSNITISGTTPTLYLHIKNSGSGDAVIISLKVARVSVPLSNVKKSDFKVDNNTNTITVKAGSEGWIVVTLKNLNIDIKAGNVYTVSIMTDKGITYQQEVQAYSS